ncbi:MAG: hypothetical protein AAGH19_09125 [Pseudomonadota bacterium]
MSEACTPTDNEEWSGPWEYVGAAPQRVQGSHGPMGATGIAMQVTYVWRRPFRRQFVCCTGDQQVTVWVDGNYAYYTADLYDAGFPVKQISVGFPAPGFLGTLSDVLGASVTIASWWVSPSQADGHRPGGPGENENGNGQEKLQDAPKAECGQWVEMPDGRRIPWGELEPVPPEQPAPPEGETPPPGPTLHPPVESRCCANLDFSQRKPILEFIGTPSFDDQGTSWKLNARIKIHHECKLVGRPRVTYGLRQVSPHGLVHMLDLTSLGPPLYQSDAVPDGKGYEIRFENQQVPDPQDPTRGRIVMRIHAQSTCGGVLDARLVFEANQTP